jgi:hypothetical protein
LRRPRSPFSILSTPLLQSRRGGRRRTDWGLLVIATVAVLSVAWLGHAAWKATRVHVGMSGFTDGAPITQEQADALNVKLVFPSEDQQTRATLTFDGRDIRDEVAADGDTVTWTPPSLSEGVHHLKVKVPRAVLPASSLAWTFTVDATAPSIDVPTFVMTDGIDAAAEATATVDPTATVTVDGKPVENKDGVVLLHYPKTPIGPIPIHAVDRAGNETDTSVLFRPAYAPGARGVHGVHVTAIAWGNDELRAGIVDLIDRGLVDTVELDLKDEAGVIGYNSNLERANEIGAVAPSYNLRDAVAYFESRGVHVVGRIVAFRDPILARAAWDAGLHDQVVQDPEGEPFTSSSYGDAAFVNYDDDAVRQYNIDIAKEAAAAGVDDILWDYVRRPEGDPSTMVVPGVTGTGKSTWQSIVEFLKLSQEELRPMGVYEGASVFGIAAVTPDSIGQRPAEMAKYLDYLAPMVYPSHFGDGLLGVRRPNAQPYDIVKASLAKFQAVTAGTGVAFVPWLQAFSLGIYYGPEEVTAQFQAAGELGIDDFLLWDPSVRYGDIAPALPERP